MSETAPIVRSVEIGAPAERVFELLADADELVRWWPDAAELDPRVGGGFRFEFLGGESVVTGEVTAFEPPRTLGMAWRPGARPDALTRIEFTITPLERGCRVEVVHDGWEQAPELRGAHDAGWQHFLGCLANLAEGRPVDRRFPT